MWMVIDNRALHQTTGGTSGPHNSNIANKLDPRVDSDRGMLSNNSFVPKKNAKGG